jgi:hypothetical protein
VCDLAFSIGMSRRLVNEWQQGCYILPECDHCCHFTLACYLSSVLLSMVQYAAPVKNSTAFQLSCELLTIAVGHLAI